MILTPAHNRSPLLVFDPINLQNAKSLINEEQERRTLLLGCINCAKQRKAEDDAK